MQQLIQKIQEFKKTDIKNQIDERIQEFKNTDKESNEKLFNELCFCLLTANFNAEKSIKIKPSGHEGYTFLAAALGNLAFWGDNTRKIII